MYDLCNEINMRISNVIVAKLIYYTTAMIFYTHVANNQHVWRLNTIFNELK